MDHRHMHGVEGLNWLDSLPSPIGLEEVRDETRGRTGTRVVVLARANADLDGRGDGLGPGVAHDDVVAVVVLAYFRNE